MALGYSLSPGFEDDAEISHDTVLNDSANKYQSSGEDTEDASETDMAKCDEEFTEIKEQMYQDKLAQLKKQLQQLEDGTLPEYMKKLKKIQQQYKERLRINEIWYHYELEMVEKDYINEKKASAKEFEEKKIDLKENIIMELEDKRKHVESDRSTIELTGDSMDMKPVTTRKLRRRPNDPMPIPEKRRKTSPTQLNYCLREEDIADDLKIINKVSGKPLGKKVTHVAVPIPAPADHIYEARIDDGRLHFDKKWFDRGQVVIVDCRDSGKVAAVISAIGTQEVWLRKATDNSKLRIYISQLQKGKYTIKRKAS